MIAGLDDALRRAHAGIERGELAQARALLLGQIARGAADPRLNRLLAQTFQREGRIDDEISTLGAALAVWPGDVELHSALLRARWSAGLGDKSADPMLAEIKAQPQNLPLRLTCADLARRAGLFDIAERLLREAEKLTTDPALDAWLGVLLDETGQLEEAHKRVARVVQAYPNQPTLRLNLAHVLLRLGRGDEALK